jgi:hypothetical protein
MKTSNDCVVHEIRLQGLLGESTLVWFEDFTVEYSGDGETVLKGPITDQAALHGLLTRICDLGLTLTSFRREGS